MTRPESKHSCALRQNQGTNHQFNRVTFRDSRTRLLVFLALASLCILISTPDAFAESKTKRSSAKSDSRTRRSVEKSNRSSARVTAGKRGNAVKRDVVSKRTVTSKRSVVARRANADRNRTNSKLASKRETRTRSRVNIRETAKVRVSPVRRLTPPMVRQTVMISPKQPGNQPATRPTLVNDIVIISEATPAARSISSDISNRGGNMPSIWPVAGPMRGGFGMRSNPFGGRGSEFHKGQDIHASYGAPVFATADGVVVNAGWLRGYGQVVYVDHGNGISTRYGHLSHIGVTLGQAVRRGDQLGLVGSTGRSTGPHLHYEVRIDGQATNPIPYLPTITSNP